MKTRPEAREDPGAPARGRRLDSWKAIAGYLKRTVRTVHRWEKDEGLPVHRHLHRKQGTVYAYTGEIDAWRHARDALRVPGTRMLAPRQAWLVAVVLAVAGLSLAAFWQATSTPRPGPGPFPHSVAVLPFAALSSIEADELLAHGIADELRGRLSVLPMLTVTGRESAFAFRASDLDPVDLARRLGVQYLLVGNLQRDGDVIRVHVRLLDEAGRQSWSRSFDSPLGSLFSLQDEIAAAAVASIAPHLAPLREQDHEPHPDAYRDHLLGREYLGRLQLDAALAAFERALEIDPQFGRPYGGVAMVRALQVHSIHEHVTMAVAREAAVAALGQAPAMAQAALGRIAHAGGDLAEAETALRRALELDPGLVDARSWLADTLLEQGRHGDSLRELETALAMDPLHPKLNAELARLHWSRGDFGAAAQRYLRLFDLPEPPPWVYREFVRLQRGFGQFQEALRWAKQGALAHPDDQTCIDELILSYLRLGMLEDAERWLDLRPWLGVRSEYLYTLGRLEEVHALNMEFLDSTALPLRDLPFVLQEAVGGFQVLTGRHLEGIAVLENLFARPFRIPQGLRIPGHRGDFDLMFAQFLALGYQRIGSDEDAGWVLDRIDEYIAGLREAGLGEWPNLYIAQARNHALRGETGAALQALHEAVDRGWRDYPFERHNPSWDALRDEPEYLRLMALVRADVAAQRETLEAAGRDGAFAGRLLAVMEAQTRQQP
jgi:TolB-like protein